MTHERKGEGVRSRRKNETKSLCLQLSAECVDYSPLVRRSAQYHTKAKGEGELAIYSEKDEDAKTMGANGYSPSYDCLLISCYSLLAPSSYPVNDALLLAIYASCCFLVVPAMRNHPQRLKRATHCSVSRGFGIEPASVPLVTPCCYGDCGKSVKACVLITQPRYFWFYDMKSASPFAYSAKGGQ